MVKRGYARISTDSQDLKVQRAELTAAGAAKIYEDTATGKNADRPGLKRLLRDVEAGDVILVFKLDRMSRSVRDLLNISHELGQRGVELRSLHDPIDTTTAMGRGFFQLIAVFAELERSFIVERTAAGRKIAKANGVKFGRKPKLSAEQISMARELLATGTRTMASIARSLGVDRSTLWRHLQT